jgi:hypothetical protein
MRKELSNMSIEEDARAFGQHFKQGGWRLGLLVARNVEPHKGQGKPRPPVDEAESEQQSPSSEKVSGAEFAAKAGVSKQNVAYYFKAWQLAADAGQCPHAESMSPDDDQALDHIDEEDEHTRDQWLVYYRKARDGGGQSQSGQSGNKAGSGSKSTNTSTAETKAWKAVEALAKTSEQLSEKLVKVVSSTPLQGEDAELARFVEELRHTRSVLDKHCREIDLVLERIGYGDEEPVADAGEA